MTRRGAPLKNENKGGCGWSLINFFDFRRTYNFRKLIAHKKDGSLRLTHGSSKCPSDCDSALNFDAGKREDPKHAEEDKLQMARSIRELMEEENNHRTCEYHENYSKQGSIPSGETSEQPGNGYPRLQSHPSQLQPLVERISTNLDLATALLHWIIEKEHGEEHIQVDSQNSIESNFTTDGKSGAVTRNLDSVDSVDEHTTLNHYTLQKTMNEVLEVFLRNKILSLKKENYITESRQSEELLNVLKIANLNKNMSQELVQRSTSQLVQYIQELSNAETERMLTSESCKLLEDIKLLGNESGVMKRYEEADNHESPQKRSAEIISKMENENPSKRNETRRSNRVMVADPSTSRIESSLATSSSNSLPRPTYSLRAYRSNERAIFHFSLQEIKRRVKIFISPRKKKQGYTSVGTLPKNWYGFHTKNTHRSIPDDKIDARSATANSCHTKHVTVSVAAADVTKIDQNNEQGASNSHKKSKWHLVETINYKDGTVNFPEKKETETLEALFTMQERSSPSRSSSNKHGDLRSSQQISFASKNQQTHASKCSSAIDDKGDVPCTASNSDDKRHSLCDQRCGATGERDLSTTEIACLQELFSGYKNLNSVNIEDISESADLIEIFIGEVSNQISPQAATKDNLDLQINPCHVPDGLDIGRAFAPDIVLGKPDQPSPLSVLEQPFLDDVSSPESTASMQADHDEPPQPRTGWIQLQQESERSELSYLRSILEASGLLHREAWGSHSLRLIDPATLFDKEDLETLAEPPALIFDLVAETLEEIYGRCVATKPWVGFVEVKVRPLPEGEELVREVWRKVGACCDGCWRDVETLDEMVGRDLTVERRWVEMSGGIDEIGVVVEDEVWEEMLEEMVVDMMEDQEVV